MKNKTKERAHSLAEALALLFVAYPVGILFGLWFLAGRLLGRVKILHEERLPSADGMDKVILVSNHPSVIDPFLIGSLLFRYYFWHPLKHAPLVVADRLNFYDRWWFWPLRSVIVPVDRDDKRKKALVIIKIKKAIECGRMILIFPEGGRTFKGKEGEFLSGQNGSRLRKLEEGVGLLVQRTGAKVLPMGIKGSDKVIPNSRRRLWNWSRIDVRKKISINVGDAMNFDSALPREQVTQEIGKKLLQLIDETM